MVAAALSLLFLLPRVFSHAAWQCPTPRTSNPGLKAGPCGEIGNTTDPAYAQTVIYPGLLTVTWTEPVFHVGSPFRIALSQPGQDYFESCILLNHIPHDDNGQTGQVYHITINIPDIYCKSCALQLIQFMTDKISGTNCTYNPNDTMGSANNQCFSNYHSCANVFINGSASNSLSNIQCDAWLNGTWGFDQTALGTYIYTHESGNWTSNWLTDAEAPALLRTNASLSGSNVGICVPQASTTPSPTSANVVPPVISAPNSDTIGGLTMGEVVGAIVGGLVGGGLILAFILWRWHKAARGNYEIAAVNVEDIKMGNDMDKSPAN